MEKIWCVMDKVRLVCHGKNISGQSAKEVKRKG